MLHCTHFLFVVHITSTPVSPTLSYILSFYRFPSHQFLFPHLPLLSPHFFCPVFHGANLPSLHSSKNIHLLLPSPTDILLCFVFLFIIFFSFGLLHHNVMHHTPLTMPLCLCKIIVLQIKVILTRSCSILICFHIFLYCNLPLFFIIFFLSSPVVLSAPHPLEPFHHSVVGQVFFLSSQTIQIATQYISTELNYPRVVFKHPEAC